AKKGCSSPISICPVLPACSRRASDRREMKPVDTVVFRIATAADVPTMATCRLTDPSAGPADSRMTAYFNGRHHPQLALMPRTGYVALADEVVIGYIAGHLTTRHGCAGELQYL